MTTQVVFDTISPVSEGLPGTAPQIFSATTDQSLATITTSGAFATYYATGIFKVGDIIYVNYNVASTPPSGVAELLTVTATSSGSLGYYLPGNYLPLAGAAVFSTGPSGYPLVAADVTVGQAALASGGSVTLLASTGSHQYRIIDLIMNSGGTNFSGGGGNRLGSVTDGTTVYSVPPAAQMQTLANYVWGGTGMPLPASAAINTATVAGSALVFKYSGGTTDYTAGSVVISVRAILVA